MGTLWTVMACAFELRCQGSLCHLPARTLHSGQWRIYRSSTRAVAGTAWLAADCNRVDGDDWGTASLGTDCQTVRRSVPLFY